MRFSVGAVGSYTPNGCGGPDLPLTVPEGRAFRDWYLFAGHNLVTHWENGDVVPRPDDLFQERLYCIRWFETVYDPLTDRVERYRHYCPPTAEDLQREWKVLDLLCEQFDDWQTDSRNNDHRNTRHLETRAEQRIGIRNQEEERGSPDRV